MDAFAPNIEIQVRETAWTVSLLFHFIGLDTYVKLQYYKCFDYSTKYINMDAWCNASNLGWNFWIKIIQVFRQKYNCLYNYYIFFNHLRNYTVYNFLTKCKFLWSMSSGYHCSILNCYDAFSLNLAVNQIKKVLNVKAEFTKNSPINLLGQIAIEYCSSWRQAMILDQGSYGPWKSW